MGVRDGLPVLEDDRVLDVANVVWCTGFRTDFGWIDLPVFDPEGQPRHYRGVVDSEPGLYFLGLVFQYSLSSDVLPNRGRDARLHREAHRVACQGDGRGPASARGVLGNASLTTSDASRSTPSSI